MDAAVGSTATEVGTARARNAPLTERILARLPGPRGAWILLWAAVPIAGNSAARSLADAGDWPTMHVATAVLLSYVTGFTLWAAARFAREITALEPFLREVTSESRRLFDGIGSTAVPLALAAAYSLLSAGAVGMEFGVTPGIAVFLFGFVINVPPFTALWAYLVILRGLKRLGEERLRLDPFPEDRTLGMRPFGRLAFVSFLMVTAGFAPALIAAASSPVGLILDSILFGASLAAFFGSLWGIHRQMKAARATYIERARDLYAEAYEPVRREGSLERLAERGSAISAAEALEKRAESIHQWPFEESTFGVVAGIAASVGAMAIARMILSPFGL